MPALLAFATACLGVPSRFDPRKMKKPLGFAPILMSSPLFAALGEEAVQRIASACVSKRLTPGNVLFKKGDSGDALFGIRRSTIRIETVAHSG